MPKIKTFSVFLSSSFLDMNVERDYLQKNVFRKLDAKLISKGARLRVVDLRGSASNNEEALTEEEKVFLLCLQGVDSCRPRIIGLLGDRYGWVPYCNETQNADTDNKNSILMAIENISNNPLLNI